MLTTNKPVIKSIAANQKVSTRDSESKFEQEFEDFVKNRIMRHVILSHYHQHGKKAEIQNIVEVPKHSHKHFWDLAMKNIDKQSIGEDKKLDLGKKAVAEFNDLLVQTIKHAQAHTAAEIALDYFKEDSIEHRIRKEKEYYKGISYRVETVVKCLIGEDSFANHPEYKTYNLIQTNLKLQQILSEPLIRDAFRLSVLDQVFDESLDSFANQLSMQLLEAPDLDKQQSFTIRRSVASTSVSKMNLVSSPETDSIVQRNLVTGEHLKAYHEGRDSPNRMERRMTIRHTDNRYRVIGNSEERARLIQRTADDGVDNGFCCVIS